MFGAHCPWDRSPATSFFYFFISDRSGQWMWRQTISSLIACAVYTCPEYSLVSKSLSPIDEYSGRLHHRLWIREGNYYWKTRWTLMPDSHNSLLKIKESWAGYCVLHCLLQIISTISFLLSFGSQGRRRTKRWRRKQDGEDEDSAQAQ